jgi:hypothetical protein
MRSHSAITHSHINQQYVLSVHTKIDPHSKRSVHIKTRLGLVRTMWRARFGRGFGPVVRQTTK